MFDFINALSKTQQILIFFASSILFFFLGKIIGSLLEKAKITKKIQTERNDAVKRSRAVIGGQVTEQLAPLFPDFPARYDEVKFIGKPVDFIAFKGLEESCDNGEKCHVDEVLFIEVKTGNSALSTRERAIKQAVDEGRVRYVLWRKD
ncbi:MAG: Holliday junction resolvase-like protein [Treponema sp.]|uniref:Holliday junction resolvase-like protein n=1 Tax=Treponema sp. TaxID=166 RepID=UPI00298EA21F|nr:Holliday junction resolvase-like protein [Treponema sp.]MDD5811275.1 Holliday junction resolvase-like protein [Treponema sp.]